MELITTAEIFLKKFPEKCKSRRLLISPEEWAKAIIQYRDNTNPDPDIPKFFMWTERTIIKHLRSYLKTRNYIVNKLQIKMHCLHSILLCRQCILLCLINQNKLCQYPLIAGVTRYSVELNHEKDPHQTGSKGNSAYKI